MWTNSLLKQNGWRALKPYYWTAFGVTVMHILSVLIPMFLTRSVTAVSIRIKGGDVKRWFDLVMKVASMPNEEIEAYLPELVASFAPVYRWLLTVSVLSSMVMAVVAIFILNPIECGVCSFYCKSREGEIDLSRFFRCFTGGRYVPVMKIMFFRWLYTFLWGLLLFVPAIVKRYEYYLIPYLLAENPNLSKERAFEISRVTMNGEKWKCFFLELSFIGWYLLGLMCCQMGVIFPIPYQRATMAEFYTCMRAKMLARGFVMESELQPELSSGEPFNKRLARKPPPLRRGMNCVPPIDKSTQI